MVKYGVEGEIARNYEKKNSLILVFYPSYLFMFSPIRKYSVYH